MIMITATMLMVLYTMMMITKFNIKMLKKNNLYPFECGYSLTNLVTSVSIQFALISFIFLIFDIELSILFMANQSNLNIQWNMTMIVFMTMMWISVMYELTKNSMQWIK